MTPEQATALQLWIDEAKKALRLTDWDIRAGSSPASGGKWQTAASHHRQFSDLSVIRLGRRFWDEVDADRRLTLAHELLHCHLIRTSQVVEHSNLSKHERQHYTSLEELAIDRLARVVAPLLPPLPEELSAATEASA